MRKFLLIMLFAMVALAVTSTALAGARDWFAWTGEVSNDYLDVNNWRWANPAFGHPADVATLLTSRHEVGQAIGAAQGGPLPRTSNLDGLSASYLAWNGGAGVYQTYGGIEIDSGMDFNIYNNAVYSVGAAGNQAVSANGLGTDPYQDSLDGTATWQGNHLTTSVHVYGGGSFAASSWSGGISAVSWTADAGVFAEGFATVNINGSYSIGGDTGAGYGGGHLTLKGYDAATVLNIANVTGAKIWMKPAKYLAGAEFGSDPAELKVILDASNSGGNFNTVLTELLDLRSVGNPDPDYTEPVKFTLELDGYTPVPGHLFTIILADAITADGTNFGSLGLMDKGWDTDFTVGGQTFQFHMDNPNIAGDQPGIYLEVMPTGGAAVPEPAGLGLLGVALLALRKRRS